MGTLSIISKFSTFVCKLNLITNNTQFQEQSQKPMMILGCDFKRGGWVVSTQKYVGTCAEIVNKKIHIVRNKVVSKKTILEFSNLKFLPLGIYSVNGHC